MRVTAKIEDCEVTVDDGNAEAPCSSRWSDQHERIKEIITEAEKACMALHQQKVKDT